MIPRTPKQSQQRRYRLTRAFLEGRIDRNDRILDLGAENDFSRLLVADGFTVINTAVDLDREPQAISSEQATVCTAFEILEHLVNPLGVLEKLPCDRLFASVPLSLWFAPAYRSKTDPWDRHFHEFEDWQFDWLLEHAGFTIVRREKWTSPVLKPGFRPLLRWFTPRWYMVEAERKGSV